ncbi:MAG: acylphosphatase [Methanomicrobiales archaeon]|nr:acylphosphatase [Methanomicrobiales archaeon]
MKMQAIITGRKVHDVGYRVFLLQRCLDLGFQKFRARNRVQDGAEQVVVQYEGDPGQVDAFNSIIREEHPPDADVSDIVFEQYEGYVIPAIDYIHIIQIEQLAKGIPAIISIDKIQGKMLEKQDCMLEKQDSMLEKMDCMLEKQDSMLEKQDNMLEKMDQMEGSITSEIRDLRTDMCSHLDRRLSTMEADIQQIKAKIGLI